MVDVAFLLLTFFILTTTSFREETKVEVDMPSSVSSLTPPETGLLTISVSEEGAVFVGLSDIATREEILRKAASQQEWEISKQGAQYFSTLQEFGVPFKEFERWINSEGEEREKYPHKGISPKVTDSTNMSGNELAEWIRWGRLSDQKMRFAIKGDVDTEFQTVDQVISSLLKWDINRFSLITSLEDGGEAQSEEE